METVDKILAIRNRDFLEALDRLVASSLVEKDKVTLDSKQKELLEMSEEDIENGRLISQEALDKRNLEWLNTM